MKSAKQRGLYLLQNFRLPDAYDLLNTIKIVELNNFLVNLST